MRLRPVRAVLRSGRHALLEHPGLDRHRPGARLHRHHAGRIRRFYSGLRFAILLAETGEMIGSIKLYDFYDSNRRCDIGYALLQAQWGKGLVGEAMSAVIDYAFNTLNMNRIEADIDPAQ
ncbi:GNAT family N-acetyltransferase [Massilia sp. B-10]|nr:GNAT family N-acetyltransferase [Massilia sp. B-10]